MNIQQSNYPFSIPPNEHERLVSVRSLLPSHIATTPELNILTGLVQDVFEAASCAVTIIDEDWQRIASSSGVEAISCPREQSACTHVVHSGRPFIVEDMSGHAYFFDKAYVTGEPHFRFYAGFPLEIDKGMTLGALCILDTKPRSLNEHECAEMQRFAQLASALLKLQRKNVYLQNDTDMLRKSALSDPLTRLYNRRALREHAAPVLRRLFAQQQSAGIMLLDMDNFKAVNDTYGHPAGDKLLKQAAERIRSVIRPGDIPVRIGGDEFCIILPSVQNDQQLETIANRLVEAFRAPFLINETEVTSAISVGTLLAPQDGCTGEELAHHADKALYAAKMRGRNCAVRFDRSML